MADQLDYSKLSKAQKQAIAYLYSYKANPNIVNGEYARPHHDTFNAKAAWSLQKYGLVESRWCDHTNGFRLTPAGRAAYEAAIHITPAAPDARPLRPDEVEPTHWTPEEWQSLYKGAREYSKQLVQERDDLRRQLTEALGEVEANLASDQPAAPKRSMRDIVQAQAINDGDEDAINELIAERDELRRQLAEAQGREWELEAALEPFAAIYDKWFNRKSIDIAFSAWFLSWLRLNDLGELRAQIERAAALTANQAASEGEVE